MFKIAWKHQSSTVCLSNFFLFFATILIGKNCRALDGGLQSWSVQAKVMKCPVLVAAGSSCFWHWCKQPFTHHNLKQRSSWHMCSSVVSQEQQSLGAGDTWRDGAYRWWKKKPLQWPKHPAFPFASLKGEPESSPHRKHAKLTVGRQETKLSLAEGSSWPLHTSHSCSPLTSETLSFMPSTLK